MSLDVDVHDAAPERSTSAIAWPAVFAGAAVTLAVSLLLGVLGSGLGLAVADPWRPPPSGAVFSVAVGLWLIVVQWLSAALGGYLTGRLRTRWAGVHTHEVFFRDTAHGLIMWSTATVAAALLILSGAADSARMAATAAADLAAGNSLTPRDALQAMDAARKAAAALSMFTALSMLAGAFVACVAAALGGQERDKHR